MGEEGSTNALEGALASYWNCRVATVRVVLALAPRDSVTAPAAGLEAEARAEGVSTDTVPYTHSVTACTVPVNVTALAQLTGDKPSVVNMERWEGRLQGTESNAERGLWMENDPGKEESEN